MARWVLRELLPVEADAARVDWAIMATPGVAAAEPRWMLSVGSDAELLREYEALVDPFGWTVDVWCPGHLPPPRSVTRHYAGGERIGRRRRVASAAHLVRGLTARLPACSRPAACHDSTCVARPVDGDCVAEELPSLRRYVNDHLK